MKLHNKNTGEDGRLMMCHDYDEYPLFVEIGCIKTYYHNFADMVKAGWDCIKIPVEPLIKDEKIRKAVKAWTDYHNITEVKCGIGTWDHAGICIPDSVLQLHSIRDRIVIQFFMNANKREKIKEGIYTIAELCGDEGQ